MTTTRSPFAPPNPAYDKVRQILLNAEYTHLRSFQPDDVEHSAEDRFEVWAGRKGSLILQVWKDAGLEYYANWPLGLTYDDLKEAL